MIIERAIRRIFVPSMSGFRNMGVLAGPQKVGFRRSSRPPFTDLSVPDRWSFCAARAPTAIGRADIFCSVVAPSPRIPASHSHTGIKGLTSHSLRAISISVRARLQLPAIFSASSLPGVKSSVDLPKF
jgi:hypothetical protein